MQARAVSHLREESPRKDKVALPPEANPRLAAVQNSVAAMQRVARLPPVALLQRVEEPLRRVAELARVPAEALPTRAAS
jgi:hypothetical protein